MERIKLKDGTVWPDPTGPDYKALAWRLRYAHVLEENDFFCAAEVMSAFGEIEARVRSRFENIMNGEGLTIPRIAIKVALDDLFDKSETKPCVICDNGLKKISNWKFCAFCGTEIK